MARISKAQIIEQGNVGTDDECWIWAGALGSGGYGNVNVGGKYFKVHRYSYLCHVGEIPDGKFLDHICGTPACWNPSHLRPVTPQQNAQHITKARSDNKSGYRGVSYYAPTNKWVAGVRISGERKHLGYYNTPEEAAVAAQAERRRLGFLESETQMIGGEWHR